MDAASTRLGGDLESHAELRAGDARGVAFVGGVSGEALQRRVPLGRLPHHRTRFRPVGLVGRADVYGQECALAVHRDVPGTSFDLQAVCQRLSKAHKAIQVATALLWNRNERSLTECRAENFINDRCRPSKSGLLNARDEAFERALTKDEIARIVRQMGQPLPLEGLRLIIPPAPPPLKIMDQLIRDAGWKVAAKTGNLIQLSDASLLAASTRLEVPFQPFYDHARERMGMLLNIPSSVEYLTAYIESQDKFWNQQVDWFNTRHSVKFEFPLRDKNKPVEQNALLPLGSNEPEPLSLVPEPERAAWVDESLAARKQLRDKLECERRAAERAVLELELRLAAASVAADEVARHIRVRPEPIPSAVPRSPTGTPSRSSPLEYGADLLSADQQTLLGTHLTSLSPPGTDETPSVSEPLHPNLAATEEAAPQPPPPDLPGPDLQQYLLPPDEPQSLRPRGP